MFKNFQRLPFSPRLKASLCPVACELPQRCPPSSVHCPLCAYLWLAPLLPHWPACWSWSTPASGPLLLLKAHSLILVVLLTHHLPSAAFPNCLFKIDFLHPCSLSFSVHHVSPSPSIILQILLVYFVNSASSPRV